MKPFKFFQKEVINPEETIINILNDELMRSVGQIEIRRGEPQVYNNRMEQIQRELDRYNEQLNSYERLLRSYVNSHTDVPNWYVPETKQRRIVNRFISKGKLKPKWWHKLNKREKVEFMVAVPIWIIFIVVFIKYIILGLIK